MPRVSSGRTHPRAIVSILDTVRSCRIPSHRMSTTGGLHCTSCYGGSPRIAEFQMSTMMFTESLSQQFVADFVAIDLYASCFRYMKSHTASVI